MELSPDPGQLEVRRGIPPILANLRIREALGGKGQVQGRCNICRHILSLRLRGVGISEGEPRLAVDRIDDRLPHLHAFSQVLGDFLADVALNRFRLGEVEFHRPKFRRVVIELDLPALRDHVLRRCHAVFERIQEAHWHLHDCGYSGIQFTRRQCLALSSGGGVGPDYRLLLELVGLKGGDRQVVDSANVVYANDAGRNDAGVARAGAELAGVIRVRPNHKFPGEQIEREAVVLTRAAGVRQILRIRCRFEFAPAESCRSGS
jgi:hypothetical protein